MKRNKKAIVAAVATLIIAGGLSSTGLVFAAVNNSQTTFISKVAQTLGISDQKLTGAIQQVTNENIDQMLKDGRITSTEAEIMKKKIQNGEFKNFGMNKAFSHGLKKFNYINSIAKYLGIDKTQIENAINNKTLGDIINSKNKTIDEVKTFLIKEDSALIQQDLNDGKITKEEEAQLSLTVSNNVNDFLAGKFRLSYQVDQHDSIK